MTEADPAEHAAWTIEKSETYREKPASSSSSESSGSSDSSDRSSVSAASQDLRRVVDDERTSRSEQRLAAAVASAQGTLNSLHQLSLTLRFAGAQHRSQRIERFRSLEKYNRVFDVFWQCACQRAKYLFPLAPKFLIDRIAESIAARRIRFLYLERHQMKVSTLSQPLTGHLPSRQHDSLESGSAPQQSQIGPQKVNVDSPHRSYQPSAVLSTTEVTKLEPKGLRAAVQVKAERPESVSSVQVSNVEFPKIPKVDPGGASFTCPYCLLVYPVEDEEDHGNVGAMAEQSHARSSTSKLPQGLQRESIQGYHKMSRKKQWK